MRGVVLCSGEEIQLGLLHGGLHRRDLPERRAHGTREAVRVAGAQRRHPRLPGDLKIQMMEKALTQRTGGRKLPIVAQSQTEFFYPGSRTHLEFVSDEAGSVWPDTFFASMSENCRSR